MPEGEKLHHIDLLDLNANTNVDETVHQINKVQNKIIEEILNPLPTSDLNSTAIATPIADMKKGELAKDILTTDLETSNIKISGTMNVLHWNTNNVDDSSCVLRRAVKKLQRRLREPMDKKFYLHKSITSHILPLTNVSFDRTGERVVTGSYDRTCRIINTNTTEVEHVLTGHDNVVFAVAFNYPKTDLVLTGSFDATAKIWNTKTGLCQSTLYGHSAEVVAAEFDPASGMSLTTASMDGIALIFDVETSLEKQSFEVHKAGVIASRFNRDANLLLTASFDSTAVLWDIRANSIAAQLREHTEELSNCKWNFPCNLIATGSLDNTARIWDVRRLDRSLFIIDAHNDEVLDLAFDSVGRHLATCSSDTTARVWNLNGELKSISLMQGHVDEISKAIKLYNKLMHILIFCFIIA
ncbi:dynein assembly factor with WDR repeat domains 1 isoform X1 [Teleopsis dalmanni]|uniref:dynein assembly factor with WDR repeat domains 1 isoform X1 n=2 Tax=Teleopsis dalmanni TaxID=139649 RepID=UPI0018CDA81D|nr:dynein assembly factor with WDR repeat domains 1 isoform X1 [Teleopsis dalmanni]